MPDVISTWDNVEDGVSCPGEATPVADVWGGLLTGVDCPNGDFGEIVITCPTPVAQLISPTDFDIWVNSERAPYCQDSVVSADANGNVVAFLSGKAPGLGSTSTRRDGFYHVSNDAGATWDSYNCRLLPGGAGSSGTGFEMAPHGIARHSSGKITVHAKGSGEGLLYSNDGGVSWTQNQNTNNDYSSPYGIAAYGEDVILATGSFNKCGSDGFGTVSAVFKVSPETLVNSHKCITNQTTGESYTPINMNGRIFVEGINNTDQIVEWDGVNTIHQTTGFSIGDKLRRSNAIDQTKEEWIIPYSNYQGGIPVTEIRFFHIYMNDPLTDLTIVDRILDVSAYVSNLVNNTIAMGAGNGIYVSAIWERVGSFPSNNLLISASKDGITWVHKLCPMDVPADEVQFSNEGNPGAVRWAGGRNWLYSYTGSDLLKRVHTFQVDVVNESTWTDVSIGGNCPGE